jgi:hypothetical protein
MLADYVRLMLFAIGLLVGVQIPAFVDQYAKRVSAHQIEAAKNFRGFQDTADRYFGGSVEALIAHHAASADPAFEQEGRAIHDIAERLRALTAEMAALSGPLIQQIFHIVLRPDREILAETRAVYTYTVPLNPAAIVCGVATGGLLALLAEALLLVGARLLRPIRARHA